MKKIIIAVFAFVVFVACTTLAYFSKCNQEGPALAEVCSCGYTQVTLTDGKIILAEKNHSNDVGHINGVYAPEGTNVVIFLSGGRKFAIATTWDHLGLRYVDAPARVTPWATVDHLVLKRNWKLLIHGLFKRTR